jgi:hypothetical protein
LQIAAQVLTLPGSPPADWRALGEMMISLIGEIIAALLEAALELFAWLWPWGKDGKKDEDKR